MWVNYIRDNLHKIKNVLEGSYYDKSYKKEGS